MWIGGPPDCGKTTVADILGTRHGATVYHFDRHEMDHIRRADPELHPETYVLGRRLADMDERAQLEWLWVVRTPEQMALTTMASWSDRIGLAVEDLLEMSNKRAIIAEGPGFFPEVVLPLISNPCQAVWMVPSEAFKRASHERRGKGEGRAKALDDPDGARRNHIERDLLMAEHYRRSVRKLNLPLIEVDGSKSAEEVAADVESRFGAMLAGNIGI